MSLENCYSVCLANPPSPQMSNLSNINGTCHPHHQLEQAVAESAKHTETIGHRRPQSLVISGVEGSSTMCLCHCHCQSFGFSPVKLTTTTHTKNALSSTLPSFETDKTHSRFVHNNKDVRPSINPRRRSSLSETVKVPHLSSKLCSPDVTWSMYICCK